MAPLAESLHLMDASATLTAAHLRRHFAQFGEVLTVEVCDTIKGSRLKVVVQVKSPNKHLVNDLRRKVHWVEGLEVVEEGEWEMRREKVEELASMWNRFPGQLQKLRWSKSSLGNLYYQNLFATDQTWPNRV